LEVSQEHYADILVASATVLEQNAIPALRFLPSYRRKPVSRWLWITWIPGRA